jgi:LmbE family N-acetylglucosaminyl deacetylase
MYVVAHEDDTLLFQSPALLQEIQSGACVRTVFLTAGDDGQSQSYWGTREQGAEAAYAQMAGAADTWTGSTLTANGHPIQLETLTEQPNVSILFMRLPDGGFPAGLGNPVYGNQSLMQLWNSGNGATPAKSSIAAVDGSTSYGYQDLISTLASLITSFQPQLIATQNFTGTFNDGDHNDHVATAYFTKAAQTLYTAPHQLVGYEDYEDLSRLPNVSGSLLEAKQSAFYVYGSFDVDGCASASACAGSEYASWLTRQYVAATETTAPEDANVAPLATATASSQSTANGQTASKAVDGVVSGYPENYEAEWATEGGKAGSTLTLKWSKSYSLDHVVLFDRPNANDQITAGKLTFSDGSSVSFGSLPNAGLPGLTVSFPAHATTSLQMTVTGVSSTTANVGLAEIQAFGVPAGGEAPPPPEPPTAVAGPAQSVASGATVTLDGSGSSDPNHLPLTYKWTQTAGPAVTLSNATAAKPTFTAPAGPASLTFSLVVSDGSLSSAPSSVGVTVAAPVSEDANVAPLATATASSQSTANGQTASKAIDGVIAGYPEKPTAEWATEGGKTGSTLTLKWSKSYSLDHVVLFDRPNANDQITAGKLTFSDGSSVSFGSLPNAGLPGLTVSFPAHATTSLQMTVTGVSSTTANVGLAEIQAFGVPAGGEAPPTNSAPVFTTPSSGSGVVGKALSIAFEATGVPTPTLSLSGSPPSGLKFTATTAGKATLSGTPTTAQTSKLTVVAKNSAGAASQTFTLTITRK